MLVGVRSVDRREREMVRASGATVFTMADIDRLGMPRVIEEASSGRQAAHSCT